MRMYKIYMLYDMIQKIAQCFIFYFLFFIFLLSRIRPFPKKRTSKYIFDLFFPFFYFLFFSFQGTGRHEEPVGVAGGTAGRRRSGPGCGCRKNGPCRHSRRGEAAGSGPSRIEYFEAFGLGRRVTTRKTGRVSASLYTCLLCLLCLVLLSPFFLYLYLSESVSVWQRVRSLVSVHHPSPARVCCVGVSSLLY